MSDSIFDPNLPPYEEDPRRHQRVCGLFALHGVNPMQVQRGSATVGPVEDGKVEITYLATIPSTVRWQDPRPLRLEDSARLGGWEGLKCEHGGDPHVAVVRRSFVATWDEVAL